MHPECRLALRRKGSRGASELPVLQKPLKKRIAQDLGWHILRSIVIRRLGLLIHKRRRLYLKQGRRHKQKITRDIRIELSHAMDLVKILVGYRRHANRPNIDALTRDQGKKQVEWPLKAFSAHTIRHALSPPRIACANAPSHG